jgi:galactose oxidase
MFALWGFVMTPTAEAQSVPTGAVILINRNSGQCANDSGSDQLGLQMIQRSCRGGSDEQWTLQALTGGYQIVSSRNGLCLEVAGASKADAAAVQQGTCNGTPNQTWQPQPSGSWSQLVAKHSGKCMEVKGASRNEGAVLIQRGCKNADNQRWTISDLPLPSLWSPIVTFPLVPAAAANMFNGRLVLWSGNREFTWNGPPNTQTYTVIYNPATGEQSEILVSNTGHQMFCPGTSMLADGRILVNGGSTRSKTSIFDPRTGIWSKSNVMNIPRGYQGNTLLSTGEVLTLGGSWSGGVGGKGGELWASGLGWRLLPGVPADPFIGPDPKGVAKGDNHLWLIAASDGWAFHAGPAAEMHWIDTKGSGAVVDAGPRGDDAYAMNGNAVVYDTGRILKLGGAPAYTTKPATDSAYVIDIRGGPTASVIVRKLAPMVFPRALHNSVVLPNGQVVIVGGMNVALTFSDLRAVLMAELWDPQTETFTRLAPMQTPRPYHSVALLLLDGRVFVGGGGYCGIGFTGECPNHPNAEILTPPYLLNADGTLATRPQITSAPAMAGPGMTITVRTDTAVTEFALVRMAAATHSVNNDQRRIPLSIAGGDPASGYRLPLPTDKGIVLPGDYMLFALNASGRPSVAKVIQIR